MLNSNLTLMLPEGGKAAIVPIECLGRIQRDLDTLQKGAQYSSLIDTIVHVFYDFNVRDEAFSPRSIVIVAVPKPIVRIRFQWGGREYSGYTDGWKGDALAADAVYTALRDRFRQEGRHVARYEALPQKQLAVRSGLAEYGRNNLAYVRGMGCFLQIMTLLTDMPCDTGPGMEIRRMDACEHCGACAKACPTQAIDDARTVIRAERCLTYYNEFIDLAPFPDWISTSAHHSLHGCMRCQLNCPQNARYLNNAMEPVFLTETDVALLLDGPALCDLPDHLAEKIRTLHLEDYLPLLPRNITAIVQAQNL